MKYWMLTLTCITLLPFTLAKAETANPSPHADALFKEAVVFCNQASRLSRTDPLQARQEFQQYQVYLERAQSMDAELLEKNAYAQREHKRCALIEDNIARAEAMPLVEESLAQCGEARTALEANDLKAATAAFDQFEMLRDQALEVTPTVLRVGSVAVRMRVCDRLVEKISLAKTERQLVQQTSSRALDHFKTALTRCESGENIINKSTPSNATVVSLEGVLNQLNTHVGQGEALAKALPPGAESEQLSATQLRVSSCQKDIVAAVEAIKQHLEAEALAQASVLQGQEVSQITDNNL